MVLRPAGYGLGATEGILHEIITTLKGMKERKDYFLWTQVHPGNTAEETKIMDEFFTHWDERLEKLGLEVLGKIPFDNALNLSLLNDRLDMKNLNFETYGNYELIFNKIFEN